MSKAIVILEVPDGDGCKFPSGEPCRLFCWASRDGEDNTCRGWYGSRRIIDFKKHPVCRDSIKGEGGKHS